MKHEPSEYYYEWEKEFHDPKFEIIYNDFPFEWNFDIDKPQRRQGEDVEEREPNGNRIKITSDWDW